MFLSSCSIIKKSIGTVSNIDEQIEKNKYEQALDAFHSNVRDELLNGGFYDNDKKFEENRIEKILDGIKNRDRELLKSLFSKKALSEAENFEGGLDYLFEHFQGTVDSYDLETGPMNNLRVSDGKNKLS